MTKKELIELGLKGIGRARVQGDTLEPAMPFLIGDIMMQHYSAATKPIAPLRHELKSIDSLWWKDYNMFNRPFFSRIPNENKADITDMMDDLTNTLATEITMLRAGTVGMFSGLGFEERKIASDFMMAHIFAQFAIVAWGNTYNKIKDAPWGASLVRENNRALERLRDNSFRMCMLYIRSLPGRGEVTISNPNCDGVFRIVAKKIYQWLKDN